MCPQPQGGADNTDIITQWGKKITPESVKTIFDYPRPQMVRSNFENLNGLWEFQAVTDGERPTFGVTLNETILVPFPVESCLSGVAPNSSAAVVQRMWYRLTFDAARASGGGAGGGAGGTAGGTAGVGAGGGAGRTLLHFGAVDWQASACVRGEDRPAARLQRAVV